MGILESQTTKQKRNCRGIMYANITKKCTNFTELLTVIIYKHRQLFTGPDQPKEMLRPLTKNSNPIQHQRGARKDTMNKLQI